MTKKLSEKQRALLREGIQQAREAIEIVARMNTILDRMEEQSSHQNG